MIKFFTERSVEAMWTLGEDYKANYKPLFKKGNHVCLILNFWGSKARVINFFGLMLEQPNTFYGEKLVFSF